ncbi:MAG TPA: T9SS type A sorting domain-containing protein [Ignavibacteria bacterium]|nr:T9SS type A sorting domain-containing protein [Ignavibacteria bacterium]
MKKYLILFGTLIILQNIFPQSNSIHRFLPLSIGNVWVYQFQYTSTYNGNSSGYQVVKVTSNSIHNSKTYSVTNVSTIFIQGTSVCGIRLFGSGREIRIDSLSGKVYGWEFCQEDSAEYMIDSLFAKLNDSAYACYYPGTPIICSDTISQNIFQFTKQSVFFTVTGIEAGSGWRYVKDFGISEAGYGNPFYYCSSNLKGCVINNILYGDTSTIIGIQPISSDIPEKFSLSQNYPNPFNPATKINFSIPKSHLPLRGPDTERVILKIFNALGNEMTILVNQQLTPGTYSVEWDASNHPSGLYFYRLTSGNFTETKRMILIK